ncbi:hypothetical protein KCU93_g2665, partial [Aureobasidium melanogenum]
MRDDTIYPRYKRIEKTVFRYIGQAPPKRSQDVLKTCRKIKAKVQTITESPPPFVIVNLRVVIKLREVCAEDFEEKLDQLAPDARDSVIRHRYWITFLGELLDIFLALKEKYPEKLNNSKSRRKRTNHGKKVKIDKEKSSVHEASDTVPSQNSFDGLEIEEILDQALEDESVIPSSLGSEDPLGADPPMPEEADDQLFRVWCHLKFLACGRDHLLTLLDEVRQKKLSIEAASVVCRHSFDHMRKVSHAFAKENRDVATHAEVLDLIKVPVAHMGPVDRDPERELTKREKLLAAERGCTILAWLRYAYGPKEEPGNKKKSGKKKKTSNKKRGHDPKYIQEAMKACRDPFCISILDHYSTFLQLQKVYILDFEGEFLEMSEATRLGCYFSHTPFIVEVLVSAHDYFITQTPKMYKALERQSLELFSDRLVQQLYGAPRGYSIGLGDDEPRFSFATEYSQQVLDLTKTMVLPMAMATRKLKFCRYQHSLTCCSQQNMMLAVCHFYCALESHNLINEDEIWHDMVFFLKNHVPPKSKNLFGVSYMLDYAKNLPAKSILNCLLLGVGIHPKKLNINQELLLANISTLCKQVQITPTTTGFIRTYKQQLADTQAGRKNDCSQLRSYYSHFKDTSPSWEALIHHMREDEVQHDRLVNFDLNWMLRIVKRSFLNNEHETVLDGVAKVLGDFARSNDTVYLREAWKKLVPLVKEMGDFGCDRLENWENSIESFGTRSGQDSVQAVRESVSRLEEYVNSGEAQSHEDGETFQMYQSLVTFYRRRQDEIEAGVATSTHASRGQLLDPEEN